MSDESKAMVLTLVIKRFGAKDSDAHYQIEGASQDLAAAPRVAMPVPICQYARGMEFAPTLSEILEEALARYDI